MRTIGLAAWAAILALATAAGAADLDGLAGEAETVVQRYARELKGKLKASLAEDGPGGAIATCRDEAPRVAAAIGTETGWRVGRTSLRTRNPANRPDAWERAGLETLERRRGAGEDAGTLTVAEVVAEGPRQVFRYLKAIPTGPVCLGCHGTELAPGVAAALARDYPDDRATGFRPGDLRGAFTLSKSVE